MSDRWNGYQADETDEITIDGVAIRGADISGTSVRGEIGAKFKPDEKSNVTLDLNLSGFAGKKRGLTGGLSAVFHI